jgi:hypothetical protein
MMGKKSKSKKKQAKLAAKWESECGGKSILEMYWDELDSLMLVLMDPEENVVEVAELRKGRAEGVAWCIAVLVNPYHPDINAIRGQAVDRYNATIDQAAYEAAGAPDTDEGGPAGDGVYPQSADEM